MEKVNWELVASELGLTILQDGDMFFCHKDDFTNIQECEVVFSKKKEETVFNYLKLALSKFK